MVCFVSHNLDEDSKADVRSAVCVDHITSDGGEKPYCIFHDPNLSNPEQFRSAFQKKLAKRKMDFRYAIFPIQLNLNDQTFSDSPDFDHCVFKKLVNFKNSTFEIGVKFEHAQFEDRVDFSSCKFGSENAVLPPNYSRIRFDSSIFSSGVNFRDTRFFEHTIFDSLVVKKESAVFNGTHFRHSVNFHNSHCDNGVFFIECEFWAETIFDNGRFSEISLENSKFHPDSKTHFVDSELTGVVNLSRVENKGYLLFEGRSKQVFAVTASLNLQNLRVADSKEVSFDGVLLRPSWFVNISLQKTKIKRATWSHLNAKRNSTVEEILNVKEMPLPNPEIELAKTCRQLEVICQQRGLLADASRFRRCACQYELIGHWSAFSVLFLSVFAQKVTCSEAVIESPTRIKNLIDSFWLFVDMIPHTAYRLLSGFGESWQTALFWIVLIWLSGSMTYYAFGFCHTFADASAFSLEVTTFQRPSPSPAGFLRVFYAIQSVFGPLEIALFGLSVRKRFQQKQSEAN